MSVINIVRKDNHISIAADSLVTSGERICDRSMLIDSKICQIGDNYLGFVGYYAHGQVFDSLMENHGEEFEFDTRANIFKSMQRFHKILKKEYHLNTSDDQDQPYESSQVSFLVANPHGIFEVDTYREVFEYTAYWSIGSGSSYALGAMHAIYEDPNYDAETIAYAGVEAASKFSNSCSLPADVYSLEFAAKNGLQKEAVLSR
ncbi:MAG: MFS transporter [Verrucomicrobiota bacterium]